MLSPSKRRPFSPPPQREAVPRDMKPIRRDAHHESSVDAFVDDWLVNTNVKLYARARGKLKQYSVPRYPLPPGIRPNRSRRWMRLGTLEHRRGPRRNDFHRYGCAHRFLDGRRPGLPIDGAWRSVMCAGRREDRHCAPSLSMCCIDSASCSMSTE